MAEPERLKCEDCGKHAPLWIVDRREGSRSGKLVCNDCMEGSE